MTNSSIAEKMEIKAGQTVLLLNAPEAYLYALGNPENVSIYLKPRGLFDVVQVFIKSKAELLKRTEISMKSLKEDGTLWVAYPNVKPGGKVIFTLNKGWDAIQQYGFEGKIIITIDDEWCAIRFKRSDSQQKTDAKSTGKMEFLVELQSPTGMDTVYFIVPFNVYRIYRTKQEVKVKGTIEGYPFHSTLVPRGKGVHYMVVTKDIVKATNKSGGAAVRVTMEVDR